MRDRPLVVVDALGRPEHPGHYSAAFRRIAAEAGLPPIRLHALRHSLAFWLHSLGIPPADCAALLGHRVDVFLSTYLPEGGDTGVNNAAAMLGRAIAAAG
jgi:integrase